MNLHVVSILVQESRERMATESDLVGTFSGRGVAVTGAGGFVGWRLTQRLLALKPRAIACIDIAFSPEQKTAAREGKRAGARR